MRQKLEYGCVWTLVRILGGLPRPLSRSVGILLGVLAYAVMPRLRKVGIRNLQIAFPDMPNERGRSLMLSLFAGLGRQLAEFCMFPSYTSQNARNVADYDGLENYLAARDRGKG